MLGGDGGSSEGGLSAGGVVDCDGDRGSVSSLSLLMSARRIEPFEGS